MMHKSHLAILGDEQTFNQTNGAIWQKAIAAHISLKPGSTIALSNFAVEGATTATLLALQLPKLHELKPDYVAVQIGYRDILDGFDESYYHARIVELFDALQELIPNPKHVLITSIIGPGLDEELLDMCNQAAKNAAQLRGFTWIDVDY